MTHRQIMVVLSGLMLGMLLAALDQTIVSTALPTIVGDLGGLNQLSWVVTAYLLTSTAATPLYGKISDLYGRRPVYIFAIVVFVAGSMLAGLSQSMWQLVATRAMQGLGAGGLMALTFAIIGDIIPPRERGRYTGYFTGVWGPGQRRRTAARRVLHRASVLAVDLLHQRAAGRRGARRGQRRAARAVPAS